MRNRFMRILIFFDLPTLTVSERRSYRKFRKMLINEGFIMMQESVYCKLAMNYNAVELCMNKIKKSSPSKGIIQSMCITEKQFSDINYICGTAQSNKLNNMDRLIVL